MYKLDQILRNFRDNSKNTTISEHEVSLGLQKFNSRKDSGPDNISPLLLKSCHNELCNVYQHIFRQCINVCDDDDDDDDDDGGGGGDD